MSTPYTLMRCRMKELISCFNACKLPIEKVTHESDPQNPKPSSVIDDPNPNYQRQKQVKLQTKSGGAESPTSWQSCESEEDDDDYIVFYFKDDDAGGGVIEERCLDRSRWKEDDANRRKKKHEKGKNRGDAKLVPLDPNESDGEHKNTLGGSSDSSTSSFAFPPIQREWTGSPVLMPRPEGSRSIKAGNWD